MGSASLPYIDLLLEEISSGGSELAIAFDRDLHWGYWGPEDPIDPSASGFAAAAERLTRRVCDRAEISGAGDLLDVGCGVGGTIASINERASGVRLTGLNIDPRQLDVARARVHARPGNTVRFITGDACALPFADASFDVVLALECIFHFSDRARFLAEARRVLRPGGRLCLTDFVPARPLAPLMRLEARLLGPFVRRFSGQVDLGWSLDRYRRRAEALGLSMDAEDVTRGVLPSYPIMRRLIRGVRARAWPRAGRAVEWATQIGEWAMGAGLVGYFVLSFRRSA